MPFRKRYSIKMSFIKSKLNNHEKCLCVPPPQPTSTTRGMFPLRKEVVVIALHPPGRLIANKSSKKLALQSSVTILLFGVGGGRTSGIVPARSGGSGPGIFNWLALLQGFSTTATRNAMYAISGNFLYFICKGNEYKTVYLTQLSSATLLSLARIE